MSTTIETRNSKAVERVFDRNSNFINPKKLIIADTHPEMSNQIENLNFDNDAIIFRRSFESLSNNANLPAALDFACNELQIQTIVLLSHSRAYSGQSAGDSGFRDSSILKRTSAAQNQLVQCKRQLADEVKYLMQLQENHSECDLDASVYGVFYLHESGVYLLYQNDTDVFVPFRECIACS